LVSLAFIWSCSGSDPDPATSDAPDGVSSGIQAELARLEQEDLAAADNVVLEFNRNIASGNFLGAAALMHPEALKRFHDIFAPIVDSDQTGQFLQGMFGMQRSVYYSASNQEIFAAFLNNTLYTDTLLIQALESTEVELLGSIQEGDDLRHVVVRSKMDMGPLVVKELSVHSVQRLRGGWGLLLTHEIEGLAAMISEQLGISSLET